MAALTLTASAPRALTRPVTGAAALGYVVLAGVENMELLRAPLAGGAAAAGVRGLYADGAVAAVTTVAGALSLALYCVFAVGLAARLRPAGVWGSLALAAGLGGPAIAAFGLAAHAKLAADAASLSDGAVTALYEFLLLERFNAGALMALFVLAAGVAGLRTGALPRPLCRAAVAVAVPLALGPVAAVSGDATLRAAVSVAFGAHAVWIAAAGLWLVAGGVGAAELVRRGAFLLLVVAAGLVGVALLAAPGATGTFFAWSLAPAPLAAFAGGVYVGSAVVYAAGLRRPAGETRGLVAAAVVLSVSVLAITLTHLEPFDFGRLQAWAWLALFAGFAATTTWLAVAGRGEPAPGPAAPRRARAALAAAAVPLTAAGLAVWIAPEAFGLPPLGGRFAGAWAVMLAALAAHAAIRGSRAEARLAALALLALPAGALFGIAAERVG
jgi:hypothetical protein